MLLKEENRRKWIDFKFRSTVDDINLIYEKKLIYY